MTPDEFDEYIHSFGSDQLILLYYYNITVATSKYEMGGYYFQIASVVDVNGHKFDTVDRDIHRYTSQFEVITLGTGGFTNDLIVNSVSHTDTHRNGSNIILTQFTNILTTTIRKLDEPVQIGLGKVQSKIIGIEISKETVRPLTIVKTFGTKYLGNQLAAFPLNEFTYDSQLV